jgi:hypothetical protein
MSTSSRTRVPVPDSPGGTSALVAVLGRATVCAGVPPRLMPFCRLPTPAILPTLGLVRHPVGLVQPDRAAARGQRSTQPPADVLQLCPRAVVW